MTYQNWIDLIGWIGSLEVILAYALISMQKVTAKNYLYQTLNGTGAVFLIINTVYYGSYPSTFINIVWLIIAGIAIFQLLTTKSNVQTEKK
jgi:hypothetical protein